MGSMRVFAVRGCIKLLWLVPLSCIGAFLEGGWGYAEGLAKYPGELVPISEARHLRNLPDGMFSSLEQLLGFLHTYACQVFQK